MVLTVALLYMTSGQSPANLLARRGELNLALQMASRAVSDATTRDGTDSLRYVQALLNSGVVQHEAFDFAAAERSTRQAISILDHLRATTGGAGCEAIYAGALSNLGTLLAERHEYARAEPVLRRALFLFEKAMVPQQTLDAVRLNLAIVMMRVGRLSEAEPILMSLSASSPSAAPHNAAEIAAALGELYLAERHDDDAVQVLTKAADWFEQSYGPFSLPLAGTKHLLAVAALRMGRYQFGLKQVQEATAILLRVSSTSPQGAEFGSSIVAFSRTEALILKRLGGRKAVRETVRR